MTRLMDDEAGRDGALVATCPGYLLSPELLVYRLAGDSECCGDVLP
jgi:hypothetical protein